MYVNASNVVFSSALMTCKHSFCPVPFDGDHPLSFLSFFCMHKADDTFKAVFQVPFKTGVPVHDFLPFFLAQFTGSLPQLGLFKTYYAFPFLSFFSIIITHKAMMARIILATVQVSSLDIFFSTTNTALFRHFAESVVLSVLCRKVVAYCK